MLAFLESRKKEAGGRKIPNSVAKKGRGKKTSKAKVLSSTFPLLSLNEPIWLKECFKAFRNALKAAGPLWYISQDAAKSEIL